jgi:LysM repeat protein
MLTKVSARLLALLVLGTMAATACTQTYSQAPLATPTLISTGLFVSPFPSGQDPLQIVADLGTQTAMAKTAEAGGTSGTPVGTDAVATATPGTGEASATPTLGSFVTSAATTPAAVTVVPATSTSGSAVTTLAATSTVGRPSSYTLQSGEYPYCIARRFNVNPDDLLSVNGLTDGSILYPGRSLIIPQTGSFPGDRSWHNHPDTYTVDTSGTTIYGVACYYGDVLPQDIASANGLSLSSTLNLGQQLTIP